MIEALEKEKQYYIKHVSEWIGANQFKFVLIKDDNLSDFIILYKKHLKMDYQNLV